MRSGKGIHLKAYKLTIGFIHVKITWPDGLPAVQFSVWESSDVWFIDIGGGGGGVLI